jgi:membrane fusion protein, multidrug efflux system
VIKLDFSVPEVFLGHLERDLPIEARSAAFRDRAFTGVVSNIGSRVDPISRATTVRALLPNHDGLLRPGMLMTVTLRTAEREALVVPERATVQIDRRVFVYVEEEGHSVRRQIVTGWRRDGMVEVLQGLAGDERIVTDGLIKVRDGGRIQLGRDDRPGAMAGPPRSDRAPGADSGGTL